jgi:hypothetical protein
MYIGLLWPGRSCSGSWTRKVTKDSRRGTGVGPAGGSGSEIRKVVQEESDKKTRERIKMFSKNRSFRVGLGFLLRVDRLDISGACSILPPGCQVDYLI